MELGMRCISLRSFIKVMMVGLWNDTNDKESDNMEMHLVTCSLKISM